MALSKIKELAPAVKWVDKARWVVDGNIWSSSGVTAGMDMMLGFVEEVYGRKEAEWIALAMEYERHREADWDPFAIGGCSGEEKEWLDRALGCEGVRMDGGGVN